MARLNVNPTRMELRRLKTRLKTAVRGHKLLKDKSDETIRQFMLYVKENKRLRAELEGEVSQALRSFMLAAAVTTSQVMEEAVAMPGYSVELETSEKNVMSVMVPQISVREGEKKDLYPYSFAGVSAELYKGNFFAGLLLNGSYMQGKMMFDDKDVDSDSWAGAAGFKTGYNVNLGILGLQPFGTAAYSYFKADRYDDNSEKYHAYNNVAFASGLKAALSLGKCWSLSAIGDYNWMYNKNNAIRVDKTADTMVNYVEYGLGLEKKWSSIILSANGMHRDGKRNGWYADLNFEVRF